MTIMPEEWFPADSPLLAQAPPWLAGWLREEGSLTRRLQGHCRGSFGLVVLDEHEIQISGEDARAMDLAADAPALRREVHLCCDGEPCIYACSLLPHSTLAGPAAPLAALGDRPLGDALFTFPDLTRGPIEVAHTDKGWARRSVFRVGGAPVLVAEWFLPGLERCAG